MHKLPGRFATDSHPTFAIIQEVSAGGMGFIIHARHRQTGHDLVLKFILTQSADIIDIERFRREGMLLAALNHPNIVRVHSADVEDGVPFLSMEWIEGQSLKSIIQSAEKTDEQPDFESVSEIFQSLAEALVHCHQHQILHRDIKPENVLIENETGRVVLVDFGLAKQLDRLKQDQGEGFQLTQTGQMLGTPSYMSPEQIHQQEEEIGPAADVWGFGATLFHYATLQAPFQGSSLLGLMTKILNQEAPDLRSLRRDTPEWLNTLCLKCLDKSAKLRPSTQDLFDAFESTAFESEDRGSHWPVMLSAVVLVFALIALGFAYSSSTSKPRPPQLGIEQSVNGYVFLEPGEICQVKVENIQRLTYSIGGNSTTATLEPKQTLVSIPVTVTSEAFSVKLTAISTTGELLEKSYHFTPMKYRDITLMRPLFDRSRWNELTDIDQNRIIEAIANKLKPTFQFVETKRYTVDALTHRIASFRHKTTGILFQLIPGGQFLFGSSGRERVDYSEYILKSKYQHPKLTKSGSWRFGTHGDYVRNLQSIDQSEHRKIPITLGPFLMGQYELSNGEWEQRAAYSQDSDFPKGGLNLSAINRWIKRFARDLEIPSETQWEYACRSGADSHFFWGDVFKSGYAWTLENSRRNPKKRRTPGLKPNSFGLYSMTGNVWEWCADSYALKASPPRFGQPSIDSSQSLGVVRGGSAHFSMSHCRSARRMRIEKTAKPRPAMGARLAKTLFSIDEVKFINQLK